jgi:fibronectin-binding autotransporter adhesin
MLGSWLCGRARRATVRRPSLSLETLENRLAPAVGISYVNDNWFDVSHPGNTPAIGDTVRNDNDTLNKGQIVGVFGTDAFSSINTAIANTVQFGTVNVLEGTYAEAVTVNVANLTLRGAQAGVAAPTRSGVPESIVTGVGNNGISPFQVTANDVTINGFTVEGNTNANQFGFGVLLGSATSGSHVLDNIIQNNIAGLSLANHSATDQAVIQGNLFLNNNNPGSVSGTGIYTDQFNAGGALTNVLIDSNTFTNDTNGGVILGSTMAGSQSDVTLSNNTFTGDGNAALLFNLTGSSVTGNVMTTSAASQFVIGGGVNGLTVSGNVISAGTTRGIRIGDFGGGGTNQNVTITDNSIFGNSTAGLEIDSAAGAYTGTLDASGNWWGSASGPAIASNPGGTGDKIIDAGGQVDYSPWLSTSTDLSPTTPGFQGNFASLAVNAGSPADAAQMAAGANNVQDGINQVTPGGTVFALPGTYAGNVTINKAATLAGSLTVTGSLTAGAAGAVISPGGAGAAGTITSGNLSLAPGTTLAVDVKGTTPGTGFDQLVVPGTVSLNGATLTVNPSSFTPAPAAPFVIINNVGTNSVQGTFANLPEGATLMVNGTTYTVSYKGGDGNDVTLTAPVQTLAIGTVGTTGGNLAQVAIVDPTTGNVRFTLTPFVGYQGGVRVATGDVNGDGVKDVIVVNTVGQANVMVFDGKTGAAIQSFLAFQGYLGGVNVAAGDLNKDGFADVIVSTRGVAEAHVMVFSGKDNALLESFHPYPGFTGNVLVASGDVNGDGTDDLITLAAGVGHVKAFSGTQTELVSFIDPDLVDATSISAGDVTGDAKAELFAGSATGTLRVVDPLTQALLRALTPFPGYLGRLSVAVTNVNGNNLADLAVAAEQNAGVTLELNDAFQPVDLIFAFGQGFNQGVTVG